MMDCRSHPAESYSAGPVTLTLVLPCHNEAEAILETARRLLALLGEQEHCGRCYADSLGLFIDDGSTDRTWALIELETKRRPRFIVERSVGVPVASTADDGVERP